ncbi:GTP-binding protein Era [Thioclava sp. SK-1]|uniref:DUF1491 family protein n=1 Tax=Thioclava sp. SK-1 TaxID=1889770 RepID=UPI0008253F79|nr:DUF1491 family protein [Thioclava sp. SK-1]OCX61644.1 GTP-binding protein Era [Thioclava sp. SK-1]
MLTAEFWVKAYLKRLELKNIPAYVIRHGNDSSGAVLVKCARLNGTAQAYQRSFDLMTGDRRWIELICGSEADVDASIRKQTGFDPDLWVIELESRDGQTLLDEDGLNL